MNSDILRNNYSSPYIIALLIFTVQSLLPTQRTLRSASAFNFNEHCKHCCPIKRLGSIQKKLRMPPKLCRNHYHSCSEYINLPDCITCPISVVISLVFPCLRQDYNSTLCLCNAFRRAKFLIIDATCPETFFAISRSTDLRPVIFQLIQPTDFPARGIRIFIR